MKTIGLLGGMSWESTAVYYRLINQEINRRLGGLHSARILLNSLDFHDLELLQHAGDWERLATVLSGEAVKLERAGADLLLICTNTMHMLAPQVQAAVRIPLLHIATATGEEVEMAGYHTVALLGTRFTMEQDFYRERLEQDHRLRVLIPGERQRLLVHRVIYEELCRGEIKSSSKRAFLRIIHGLTALGAEAVIFGCTEISLLVKPEESGVPVFDTTRIHAIRAADAALKT